MFEKYTFIVGQHFLPAIINDDWTGLSEQDEALLHAFLCDTWFELEMNAAASHWAAEDTSTELRHCDVTGLLSECEHVHLMVAKNAA